MSPWKPIAAISLCIAVPAAATTYVGTRTIGPATAQLSIVTDGTIGLLSEANLVDWTIILTSGGSSAVIEGPGDGVLSALYAAGTSLIATGSGLFFDFDGNGLLNFQSYYTAERVASYCVDGATAVFTCTLGPPQEVIGFENDDSRAVRQSGLQLLASVVPEPRSWALMLGGFGLAGAALRRQRRVATAID